MTVIEGQCPFGGADKLIADWAIQHQNDGVIHVPMPAFWQSMGGRAGPERNRRMLSRLMLHRGPKLVVGFHPYLDSSKGTKHMLRIAEEAGLKPLLFDGKNEEDISWG